MTARPVVKVIDFGVAKAMSGQLTDRTLFTRIHANDRNAAVHEPRTGGDEWPGRRHPQRHLFAGSDAVRTADRHDAVRSAAISNAAAFDEMRADHPRRGAAAAQHRLTTLAQHSVPTVVHCAADRAAKAQPIVARRSGLDRHEGVGKGPSPPL